MRPKSKENAWLPDNVKKDKYGYAYTIRKPYVWHRLAGKDATKSEVLIAYERYINGDTGKLPAIMDSYLNSPQFASLAPGTQQNYRVSADVVKGQFVNFTAEEIMPYDIRLLMDDYSDSVHRANKCHTLLSAFFSWGIERNFIQRSDNPCRHVTKYKTDKGGRYVDDKDYQAFYNYLINQSNLAHAAAMEIAYLCSSRKQDVLRIHRRKPDKATDKDCYLTQEGIHIAQAKTGKQQVIKWSERLRKAVNLQSQLGKWVVSRKDGDKYTPSGFNKIWLIRQAEAAELGIISERFRFHDLKVKAISDYKGNKKKFSGHATEAMAERYNRLPDQVRPVE